MRRARRTAAALAVPAVLAVLAPVLTACGGGDEFDRYCGVVEEQQSALTSALRRDDGAAGLLPGLPVFRKLEDAAPTDIADDWSVITQRLGALADALEEAGADPATYDPKNPPSDVSAADRQAIALAAGSVTTEAMREALGNVQQEARDVCHTELTLL